MSDQLRESVSALMDGEANDLELKRLLTSSGNAKGTVDEVWSRFHLIQDVMQDNEQSTAFRHLDISSRVGDAIRQQSTIKQHHRQWFKPIAGFAVAASVAAGFVVLGIQPQESLSPNLENTAPATEQPAVASRVYPVPLQSQVSGQGGSMQASGNVVGGASVLLPAGSTASLQQADAEAQQRLEKYLLRHTERAALNNGQGLMSFARVADFDPEAEPKK